MDPHYSYFIGNVKLSRPNGAMVNKISVFAHNAQNIGAKGADSIKNNALY